MWLRRILTSTRAGNDRLAFGLQAATLSLAVVTVTPFVAATPAAALSVPSVPRNAVATGEVHGARVAWDPPLDSGGAPITTYRVTQAPGGRVVYAASASTSVIVDGLADGMTYTFTVEAINGAGISPPAITNGLRAGDIATISELSLPTGARAMLVNAINNSGVVVGAVGYAEGGFLSMHATKWIERQPVDLVGELGGPWQSRAQAVNDAGHVTGIADFKAERPGCGHICAFISRSGASTFIPGMGDALGVDANGTVIGDSQGDNMCIHAALWGGRSVSLLPTGCFSRAVGMNETGAMAVTLGGGNGVVLKDGVSTPIRGVPGKCPARLESIASNEVVAGNNTAGGLCNGIDQAFMQHGPVVTDLGVGHTTGANRHKVAIGNADKPWVHRGAGRVELQSLLPVDSPWLITSADAINDRGQVVGRARLDGRETLYVLTLPPVLTPTSLTLEATPDSTDFGSPLAVTARVTQSSGTGVAGGVQFTVDGSAFGEPVPLVNGRASFSASILAPGAHRVEATYAATDTMGASIAIKDVSVTCASTLTGSVDVLTTLGPGSWCLNSARFSKDVMVGPGASVAISQSVFTGRLTATAPRTFRMCGSTAFNPVTIQGAEQPVIIGDPGGDRCATNSLQTLLTVDSSAGVEVASNVLRGLVVRSNRGGAGGFPGDAPVEIGANQIFGTLNCENNNPAPSNDGRPNRVTGTRLGQCSSPLF